MRKFETENCDFHLDPFLVKKTHFTQMNKNGFIAFWNQTLNLVSFFLFSPPGYCCKILSDLVKKIMQPGFWTFLNLNKMKKRLSNHMSQYFIHKKI